MTSKLTTLGIAATLVLSGPLASASECVIPARDGRVTLDCRGVPLGQVFRGLRALAPIDTNLIDSAALDVPIYVGLTDASMAQAVQATLDASGISFIIMYGMYGSEAAELKIYASARSVSPAAPTRAEVFAKPPHGADGSEYVDDDEEGISDPQEAAEVPYAPPVPGEEVSIVTPPPPGAPGAPAQTAPPFPANVQTMEEILDPNAATAREAPAATMEEILARKPAGQEKPKQQEKPTQQEKPKE